MDWEKFAITLSTVCLSLTVVYASFNPSSKYSLSIYAENPLFWLGVTIAGGLSIVTIVLGSRRRLSIGVLYLVGVIVLFAPTLLGFYFHAGGDGLTQLGWLKAIKDGEFSIFGLRYMGLQLISLVISSILNISLRRALMFSVVVYGILYMVTLPIVVRHFTGTRIGYVGGAIFAVMFGVVDAFSTRLTPHPFSLAMLSLPFVSLAYFYSADRSSVNGWRSSIIGLCGAVVICLAHPLAGILIGCVLIVSVLVGRFPIGIRSSAIGGVIIVLLAFFYRIMNQFILWIVGL